MTEGSILVTGATGFLGRHVCPVLVDSGFSVRGLVRTSEQPAPPGAAFFRCADLADRPSLRAALAGIDTVIHLAARAHVMVEECADPLGEYRRTNVEGTRALVEESLDANVRRFVFISSVKAVGESSKAPWTEDTPAHPTDPYGISKLEAERIVMDAGISGTLATTILRLPLAYGPGMRANMLRLFEMVDRGLPLPLGRVRNRRSLVFAGNVAAAIVRTIGSPETAGQIFFVRDEQEPSTPELVRAIAHALDRPARLVPVPPWLLRAAGRAGDLLSPLGRVPVSSASVSRLLDSLSVDASKLARMTGFHPPFALREGLRSTGDWYRRRPGVRR
jgi:nucleoside-diphosphate-sugar epimerase